MSAGQGPIRSRKTEVPMCNESSTTKKVIELLRRIIPTNCGLHWRTFGVLLRDAVFPVGCRIGRAAQTPIDLIGNILVGMNCLRVPVKVKLLGVRVVDGLSDSAAGEGLCQHAGVQQMSDEVLGIGYILMQTKKWPHHCGHSIKNQYYLVAPSVRRCILNYLRLRHTLHWRWRWRWRLEGGVLRVE
jgi:hypothetical protein